MAGKVQIPGGVVAISLFTTAQNAFQNRTYISNVKRKMYPREQDGLHTERPWWRDHSVHRLFRQGFYTVQRGHSRSRCQ
jgi:hypothetical protein